MLVSYAAGQPEIKSLVESTLSALGLSASDLLGVLGRHATRALEAKYVAAKMADWVLQLKPGGPVYAEYSLPDKSKGMGLWEGPRGALGHWINIDDGKVKNYQAVVPTTWNASPVDASGQHGPMEYALIGTKIKDEENPYEIGRIVRSFDPCLACAVHMLTPKGEELRKFRVV
jgi:hydrogenase large subunit